MNIAIVDDEKNVRLALETALSIEKFSVYSYENGKLAFDDLISQKNSVDFYILDIMMPVMDGLTLFKKIKEYKPNVPIIFLTSRDEEFDKVLGLELGADDYLCKPFSMRELIARIHVIARRYSINIEPNQKKVNNSNIQNFVQCGSLILNLSSYTAKLASENLELTVTEFRLLEKFISSPDIVLSREQLIQAAYPDDTYLNDRAVDCHIKRLRKKIGSEKIETVYGLGYRFPKTDNMITFNRNN